VWGGWGGDKEDGALCKLRHVGVIAMSEEEWHKLALTCQQPAFGPSQALTVDPQSEAWSDANWRKSP